MADEPMFIWYKRRGKRQLQPANRAGRLAFAAFMAAITLPVIALGFIAARWPWAIAVYVGLVAACSLLFFRYARDNAKVIDLEEVIAHWDEFKRWRSSNQPKGR